MNDPSHLPGVAAAHAGNSQPSQDNSWVSYSSMDKGSYTFLLTSFSLTTSFLSHPLSVVIVRQQASSALIQGGQLLQQQSVVGAMRTSFRQLGMRGLFRGWLPIASLGIPSDVLYYSTVEHTREQTQILLNSSYPSAKPWMVDFILSATSSCLGTVVARLPYVPAEVVSTRQIIQGRGGLGCLAITRLVYQEGGMAAFFRGFFPSCMVGMVGSTAWWWSYSTFRRFSQQHGYSKEYPVAMDACAGLAAGCAGILLSHPFDTIKTRIMTSAQPKPIISEAISVLRKHGVTALYRGLAPSLYQTAFSSMVFATCYEIFKINSIADR